MRKSHLLATAALAASIASVATSGPAHAQLGLDIGNGGGSGTSVGTSVGVSVGTDEPSSPDVPASPQANGLAAPLDQNGALEAVKSGRAVPLDRILSAARLQTSGEVIDAQLLSVNGFLLYELTVVGPDGDVSELYFYARSGEPVREN